MSDGISELSSVVQSLVADFVISPSLKEELFTHGGGSFYDLIEEGLDYLQQGESEKLLIVGKDLIKIGWEQLHFGHWQDVPECWREFYSIGCLLKAIAQVTQMEELDEALEVLDKAALMGSPKYETYTSNLISSISKYLAELDEDGSASSQEEEEQERPAKRIKIEYSKLEKPSIVCPVERVSCPSLEEFLVNYMIPQKPVIITDSMKHWPASQKWNDLNYFKKVAGFRTVPIEFGKNYLESDWGQKLTTLKNFIDEYILSEEAPSNNDNNQQPKSKQVGYLAQTPLFDQIPTLKADICTPDYCGLSLSDSQDESESPLIINAWFGPKGTVSPAHHDPYLNLLAQVVGYKYIKLFAPEFSENLYPHTEKMLFNSSQVDVENPNNELFPLFANAPFIECILGPGEMLFIPPKWWHYVRSLSVSFSVSFWWGTAQTTSTEDAKSKE